MCIFCKCLHLYISSYVLCGNDTNTNLGSWYQELTALLDTINAKTTYYFDKSAFHFLSQKHNRYHYGNQRRHIDTHQINILFYVFKYKFEGTLFVPKRCCWTENHPDTAEKQITVTIAVQTLTRCNKDANIRKTLVLLPSKGSLARNTSVSGTPRERYIDVVIVSWY